MSRRPFPLADVVIAGLAVAVTVEQQYGAGTLRLVALRGIWWTSTQVAHAAARVAMAAELAYRDQVTGGVNR